MEERTVKEILFSCTKYLAIDGSLTSECDSQEKLQDLTLISCLSQIYPNLDMLEVSLSN